MNSQAKTPNEPETSLFGTPDIPEKWDYFTYLLVFGKLDEHRNNDLNNWGKINKKESIIDDRKLHWKDRPIVERVADLYDKQYTVDNN